MNCAKWEERVALYLGGDLASDEAAAVERHLSECTGCQVFAGGMRESLALLREAHADELPAAAYAAVRARVLEKVQRRSARGWIFALAAAAAFATLLAIVWMRPSKPVVVAHRGTSARPEAPVIAPAIAPDTAPPAHVAPLVRVHRRVRPRVAPVRKDALPETPLVVKMVTDDPNVVIYWITDTRGE